MLHRRYCSVLSGIVLLAVGLFLVTITSLHTTEQSRLPHPQYLQLSPGGPPVAQRRIQQLITKATSASRVEPADLHIIAPETYHHNFSLGGATFDENGVSSDINSHVVTCMIHSFSPYIERTAASRFIDPAQDNIFYANSPAITWFGDELVLVIRIWLDRERYEEHKNWPANAFADNYFFTQRFNRFLEPVDAGRIMGIPMPKQFWIGDGPIEPRVIKIRDRLLVSFNGGISFGGDNFVDWTLFWDYLDSKPTLPLIRGGSPVLRNLPPKAVPCDKHWMPFSVEGRLYFVHSLDPLRLLHCSLGGACNFVFQAEAHDNRTLRDLGFHLRGGTPLQLYRWPYFVGVAHSTLYKQDYSRYYAAHLLLLSVSPPRLVYISDPIEIHPTIYQRVPMVRRRFIDNGFVFPVGLILEDSDSLVLGAHVNDHSSMLFRMRGLKLLLHKVMRQDMAHKPDRGPPAYTMHKYIHDRMANLTGITFRS